MKRILPVIFILLSWMRASAQQGIYIPADGKVALTGILPVSFYQDTRNDGLLGSNSGATLYFFGRQWTNGTSANLSNGTGAGGVFRFAGNNPVNTSIGRQLLYGGYNTASASGASFPNLTVDNSSGIELGDLNDTKIRTNLHFNSGNIYLSGWNLVVGDGNPGSITGYNENAFVVTGSGIAGGYLVREKLGNTSGKIVFPIGTDATSYNPVAVEYTGTLDDFRARVFDNVYSLATSGPAMLDTFIYKTWNIGRLNGGGSGANLTFQHMNAVELPEYAANRDNSVINRFSGGRWEEMPFQQLTVADGDLSANGASASATMHTQTPVSTLGNNEYFSKSTHKSVPGRQVMFLRFMAQRISDGLVETFWTTSFERNVSHFVLERKLEHEAGYTAITQVASGAVNGNSRVFINYYYLDPNPFDGWSYYRVRAVLRNGNSEFSEIRAVPPNKKVEIFPNPNYGQFKIKILGYRAPMVLHITNVWGQVVREYRVRSEAVLDITNIAAATYFVVLYDEASHKVVYRGKVLVLK
ncbi:T9SS type A sorting domain-containing protein [Chitinophaga horti]|uniref:T9SS type A sorting domain-containing protein n=1 Tax=Chitinophaga horti TaxID=2920382 RepID=A0ABY6IXK6_9BACT|nr:T9SS type A sorting domain-containing protein [Chitinophaga horti]UYQ91936.1 T9SS type A sorting domain-containing protein [Chitinophaga horti]